MKRRPRRGFSWRLAALAVACVLAGILFDWRQIEPLAKTVQAYLSPKRDQASAQPKQAPAVPVTAVEAKTGDFPVVLTGLGNVQPFNTVLVRTRVDGAITKIHFQEGQIVHEGDLLAEIDPRPFKAAVDQANAKRQQDQANLDNAKRDLSRYQALAKSDYATRQQLDTQTATVAQLTAQVASDQASLENAQTQLDYTMVRAPLTGRTGFRLVDQGNIVNASSQSGIVSIAQLEPIAVVFTQTESSLPQITSGLAQGPLTVDALTSDGAQVLGNGTLATFNNEIDTASGTIRLKASFANKDGKLWPGLAVTTRLTVATRKNVVLVPATAVQRGPNGLYTFVVQPNNKVEQRPIKVSLSDDQTSVVDEGVKLGEKVVTAGQYRLQQDVLVKASPPSAPQTPQRDS